MDHIKIINDKLKTVSELNITLKEFQKEYGLWMKWCQEFQSAINKGLLVRDLKHLDNEKKRFDSYFFKNIFKEPIFSQLNGDLKKVVFDDEFNQIINK